MYVVSIDSLLHQYKRCSGARVPTHPFGQTSREAGLSGRVLYLDLDTIVAGSLDEIAGYSGPFAALSVEGMANERRPTGLNSSVMCWEAGGGEAPPAVRAAYDQLRSAYEVVSIYL